MRIRKDDPHPPPGKKVGSLEENVLLKSIKHFVGFSRKEMFSPYVLSSAFSFAWFSGMFYSGLFFEAADSSMTYDLVLAISLACCAVASFICANRHEYFDRLLSNQHGWFIGPIIGTVGSLGFFVQYLGGAIEQVGVIICGILVGVGWALITIDQGRAYAALGGDKAASKITLAYLISIIAGIVVLVVPPVLLTLIASFLPLASIIALHKPSDQDIPEPLSRPEDIDPKRFLVSFGIAALVFGFAAGFLRDFMIHAVSTDDVVPMLSTHLNILFNILTAIIAALIVRFTIMFSRHREMGYMYRPVLLLMISAFLFYPILDSILVPMALMNCGYSYFGLLVWIVASDISYRTKMSPTFIFGGCFGFVNGLCPLLGLLASRLLTRTGGMLNENAPLLMGAFFIIALVIVYLFILDEKQVGTMGNGEEAQAFINARRLEKDCGEFASHYKLSKREADVLLCLVQRKTPAAIQQELFISQGTYNAHVYHIYQKTGVHKREELLDLFDKYDG